MATLKEKWKEAILERNWNKIEKLYEIVCKDKIPNSTASKQVSPNVQVQQEDFSINHQKNKENSQTQRTIINEDGKEQAVARKFSMKNRKVLDNKWVDDGEQYKDERVDIHDNINLAPRKIHERGVRKTNLVDVQCWICGKRESVHPVFSAGYSKNKDENCYACEGCKGRKNK